MSSVSDFTRIGKNPTNLFKGTFNGDSHIISNLKISTGGNNVGLFGYNGGTIKNVTLNNVDVTGWDYVGGLVGYNLGGTIENCTVSGTVTGTNSDSDPYVGGLVGRNYNGSTVSGNTQLYELTLQGVSVTGTPTTITDGTNTYYAGEVTLTAKTGYVIDGVNVTQDTTITATVDTANHYVFGNATDGYTLATSANVGSYPDLIQVYALTLPEGVSVNSGTFATDSDGKYYATGSVTFTGAKTGYVIDGVNVTQDTTITASLDTTNHYVLADDTKTLATAANTTDYPNLVQVYELTVPDSLKVTGDTVAKDSNGNYYAAGNVTLTAANGYTLQNVSVDGTTYNGNTLTVNADTKILADCIKFNNTNISKATAAEVGGTTGNLSTFNGVYSITAAKENSTLVGNNNNNTVVLEGGGVNILTGGGGNDTYKFESGSGIVTDYGIGATKSSTGKALSAPLGSDVIKLDGKVSGVYFDRDATSKKNPTFTAVITYDSNAIAGDDTQIIVLKDIIKKPTKYGKSPVYQTNDVAAATMKIWDTSGSKQAVLSAAKLKTLFKDDDELSTDLKTQIASLGKLDGIGDLNLPAVDQLNQNMQATFNGGE